mgnify:CR=1 FL=1
MLRMIYAKDVTNGIAKIALAEKKIETGVYNLSSGNFIKIFCKLIRFNNKFLKFGSIPEKKTETIKELYGL